MGKYTWQIAQVYNVVVPCLTYKNPCCKELISECILVGVLLSHSKGLMIPNVMELQVVKIGTSQAMLCLTFVSEETTDVLTC